MTPHQIRMAFAIELDQHCRHFLPGARRIAIGGDCEHAGEDRARGPADPVHTGTRQGVVIANVS